MKAVSGRRYWRQASRCGRWLGVLALAGVCAGLAGCAADRYQLVLENGTVIETRGKPELADHRSVYRFKDLAGDAGTVPVARVQAIMPRQAPD